MKRLLVKGNPACVGEATGKPVVVELDFGSADAVEFPEGAVLVATHTNPDYVPLMSRASAIVTEKGGRTCHAAIVSRELGVPCIVGATDAIKILAGEAKVTVLVTATSGEVWAI